MSWSDDGRWRRRREVHYDGRVMACFAERAAHVDAMFRDTVTRHGDREALVLGQARLGYGELDTLVERVAGNLARRGVDKGERVAVALGNRLEFVHLVLACARLGAIVVPLNVRQRRPEIEFALNDSGARVLVHEAEVAGEIPEAARLPALEHRFVCGGEAAGSRPFDELLAAAEAPARAIAEEETACILYTSGTTGRPKGAMLTHLGLVHSALHFELCMGLDERDRTILAVPASHVTGLVAVILAMVGVGGCTIMMPAFKAREFLELAARERLSQSVMVPAMYNLCLLEPDFEDHDLSAWRVGGYGGAPMPTATIDALAARLPRLVLMNAYGATETTSPTTVMPPGETAGHEDSVGQTVPCGEVAIMDEDGREVAPGEPAEVWIAGPMVVPGYWQNPEATGANFVGGFWRSGDIGSRDGEGFLRVLDRKKDMINRAGYKVYSAEVENLLSHHPAVVECAVVASPDPVLGERVHAFVVAAAERPSAQELTAFCDHSLSDYKVPEFFTFLDQPLPRNANGKVIKSVLREQAERMAAAD
jgi:acyl-CoA synthetase (AMP-forming)/AMP-acid ligase II